MTIDKNTKVTLGVAVAVCSALLYAGAELHSFKSQLTRFISIEDAQNWTDQFRSMNDGKGVRVPNINDVIRQRRQDALILPVGKEPVL